MMEMSDSIANSSSGSDIDLSESDSDIEIEPGEDKDAIYRDQRDQNKWVYTVFGNLMKDNELLESDEILGQYTLSSMGWNFDVDTFNQVADQRTINDADTMILLPKDMNAADYFELFWTEELWQKLVEETNKYAELQKAKDQGSGANNWVPITIAEMKRFIGLCFAMGLMKLPCRKDYWRTSSRWWGEAAKYYTKVMARERFVLIWHNLHIENCESDESPDDKLWKIRWYLEFLDKRFKTIQPVKENVTVGKSAIRYKQNQGVKIWKMSDSKTGYCHGFSVYRTGENQQEEKKSTFSSLCEPLFGSNVKMFIKQCSLVNPEMLSDFKKEGLQACIAVESMEALPKNYLPENERLKKFEFKQAQKDELTYGIYRDKHSTYHVLSNFHDPKKTAVVQDRVKKQLIDREVPECFAEYKQNCNGIQMCDVTVADHLLNLQDVESKLKEKTWKGLFFHLMLLSASNAYIVARQNNARHHVDQKWTRVTKLLQKLIDKLVDFDHSDDEDSSEEDDSDIDSYW